MRDPSPEQTCNPPSPLSIVEEIEATFESAVYGTARALEDRFGPDVEPADEEEAADANSAIFAGFQAVSDIARILDTELRRPMERAVREGRRGVKCRR
jgi:hypothetical protein